MGMGAGYPKLLPSIDLSSSLQNSRIIASGFPLIYDESSKKLHCSVKNYDWGLPGQLSHVAKLSELNSGFSI
ncbi:hypothetical protein RYX36_012642 [Vicia faba]